MLSWITGSKEGLLEPDSDAVSFIEPPETPAPVFVVRAFKQALFGTPQPTTPALHPVSRFESTTVQNTHMGPSKKSANKQLQPSAKQHLNERKASLLQTHKLSLDDTLYEESPAKKAGILMTPGTISGRRKQVTFGEQVVNNEGKTPKFSKSGLPDNCPGKFPSPFTPKTMLSASQVQKPDAASQPEKKTESKFRENFDPKNSPKESRANIQSTNRARDDSDITSDLNFPLSSSGRYWKEQYEVYASRSEAELKRLIAKHKLAKDYARMKDAEALSYKSRLDIELNKRKERESGLSNEVKDMRERLRLAMGENSKMKLEVALLRKSLEEANTAASQHEKVSSQKYDDLRAMLDSKETLASKHQPDSIAADVWVEDDGKTQYKKLLRREGRSDLHSAKPPRRPKMATKSTESFDSFEEFMDSLQRTTPEIVSIESPAPLGERNLNIMSTPPSRKLKNVSSKPDISNLRKKHSQESKSGLSHKVSQATIIHVDDVAPLDGLVMQASQPTTPPVLAKIENIKGRTPRSAGGSKLDEDRRVKAKERLQARRKSRLQIKSPHSATSLRAGV